MPSQCGFTAISAPLQLNWYLQILFGSVEHLSIQSAHRINQFSVGVVDWNHLWHNRVSSQSGFSATSVQSSYSRTSSYGFVSLLFKTLFNSFKTVHWTLIIELKINRTESRPRAVSVQLRSSFIWTSSNEPFLVLLKTWIPPAWPIYEFLVVVVDSSLLYENRIQIYECVKGDSCVI